MPRTYRGSSATPLLADYLRANQQQGAQQAGALSQRLAQEGQQARSAVDDAQAKVEAARLGDFASPAAEMFSELQYQQAPKVVNGPAVDFAGAGVNSGALQQQVGQAASNAGLTGSLAGIGALNAQKYGYGAAGASAAPRSTGASMLDAAAIQAGGGRQLRAAGRQNMGLRDYLGGAETRGNEAAVAKARPYMVASPSTPQPRVIGRAAVQANGALTPPHNDPWAPFEIWNLGKNKKPNNGAP